MARSPSCTETRVFTELIMNKSLTDSVPVRQADCRAGKLYYNLQDKVERDIKLLYMQFFDY